MDSHALREMMVRLDETLVIATSRGVLDSSLQARHAYYLAAYNLAKRGHAVEVLSERGVKGADLYLPKTGARIEVKYATKKADGSCAVSLGNGSSLSGHSFDYLVAVVYGRERPDEEQDAYVFSFEELRELLSASKADTKGFASSPYSLYFARDAVAYRKKLAKERMPRTRVEDALNSDPSQFRRAWDKIPQLLE